MAIDQLEISNFRNLDQVSLSPSPHLNFIVGKNGSGKTSRLEAINFLGTGRSFRTPHSKNLIGFGHDQFVLFARISTSDVPVSVGIAKNSQSMNIKIANQVVSSASVLADMLPVQIINPDVHKLLEEGPRYRRRFIEWGVFHVKPNYFGLWQQCRHILKQRNAALKQHLSLKELKHWDTALAEISELITSLRRQYIDGLQPYISALLKNIPDLADIQVRLDQGWPKSKILEDALKESIDTDRSKGFTQYGPHRADLKISLGGVNVKHVVSRGQQKLITAFFKLAQMQLLQQEEQRANCVLLVDDLPAELDHDFRELLMGEIENLHSQAFVTATDQDLLSVAQTNSSIRMFHVEHGKIQATEI